MKHDARSAAEINIRRVICLLIDCALLHGDIISENRKLLKVTLC